MERISRPLPKGVDTRDSISVDSIGEWPRADTKNVAALIDEMAGDLDRGIGARSPRDVFRSVFPILDVPRHSATDGSNFWNPQLSDSTQIEVSADVFGETRINPAQKPKQRRRGVSRP
jgi:hypothetical protein